MNSDSMQILDIHTHHQPPYPEGIIAMAPEKLPAPDAFPGQLYSVGVHPWDVRGMGLSPAEKTRLREAAQRDDVVALGECGIDSVHEGAAPLFSQLLALKAQVEISEEVGKPLILHCVKAQDIIIGVRKDLNAGQPWIVHGFRGKPTILKMLTDAGIYVSYGEKFNPDSVAATPLDRIFVETDASSVSIEEIIQSIRTIHPTLTPAQISQNLTSLLKG